MIIGVNHFWNGVTRVHSRYTFKFSN